MKITVGPLGSKSPVDVIAIVVHEESLAKDATIDELDKALGGALRKHLEREEWTGKKDSQLVLPTYGKATAHKIALFGLGAKARATPADERTVASRAARWAQGEKATTLGFVPATEELQPSAEGVTLGAYRFTKYLTGDRKPKKSLEHVILGGRAPKGSKGSVPAVERGHALAEAVLLARDLVNEPPNELTPAAMADRAREVAQRFGLKCTVWDHATIRARGMKLLDAVGRGSTNEPRFVHVEYKPAKAKKGTPRVVVVGKGLTFDSGGLCIKQAQGMGDMKCDMAGAALSVALMQAVGALKPDVEVHCIFAAAENMPDGNAYRPGDVWGSLDGKSVEIVNTDAEGRLVLADALAYAVKLKPDYLIDHATLTGACVVALGPFTAGFYASDEAFAESYLAAAKSAGESLWRMPLAEELRDSLKSDVADLKHTGDRWGGSITAALFLKEFVGNTKWAHLDIAGPAFLDRVHGVMPKGGTGFGLLTLWHFLERLQSQR